jgi:hypothetical protein
MMWRRCTKIAGHFEARSSHLKSVNSRALSQAKMEAISHNNAVWKHIEQSQQQSKRKLDVNSKLFFSDENFKVQKTE